MKMEKVIIKTVNDQNGNIVKKISAKSALGDINPELVKEKIDKVVDVATEQIGLIIKTLQNISQDADSAIVVEGTNMSGTFEEICNGLSTLPNQIKDSLEGLYVAAVNAYNQQQIAYNEAAENEAKRIEAELNSGN